jgi:hypothetical protein
MPTEAAQTRPLLLFVIPAEAGIHADSGLVTIAVWISLRWGDGKR